MGNVKAVGHPLVHDRGGQLVDNANFVEEAKNRFKGHVRVPRQGSKRSRLKPGGSYSRQRAVFHGDRH